MMSAEEEALVMEAGETSAGGPPAPVAVSHTHTAAQPGKNAPDDEDERPICPNHLLDIDRLLTKPDGRPTLAFKLLLLSSLPLPIMFCSTGTFLFPAVHDMWKGGDLREVVCGIGFVLLILSQPLNMFVVRRVCRPQLLASIGIGRDRISRAQYKGLEKARQTFHAFSPRCFVHPLQNLPQLILVSWICVWEGRGASESATINRISGVFFVQMTICSACLFQATSTLALKAACVLAANKISALAAALKTRPTGDEWNRRVAKPAADLVADMDILCEICGPPLLLSFLAISNLQVTMILAVTSDILDPLGSTGSVVVRCVGVFFIVVLGAMPLFIAGAPAQVSTSFDEFREQLNRVRLEDLSEATDIRVRLLERALMNVNRGQGVGVTVLGTVIDKRRLTQLAGGMGAVVATVAPVLYSYQPPERNSAAVETADAGFNVTWCVPGCVAR